MEGRLSQTSSPGPDALGKFDDVPGSTPRERLQNAHARLRASASALPNPIVSTSATPSSAGDIDPAPASSMPETALPLSVRVHESHIHQPGQAEEHSAAADIVVPPSLIFPEQAGIQTIQPSAIFDKAENVAPGSLNLGPSEFAISLPMDSRSKDEYELALADHSHSTRLLLGGFKSAEEAIVSDTEVRMMIAKVNLETKNIAAESNISRHSTPGRKA